MRQVGETASRQAAILQIVQLGDRDVGVVQVDRPPGEILLVDIQIVPMEQGKGIGTTIIRGLQDEARRQGKVVCLQVNRANRARRLYERLGFVVIEETETHYLMRWPAPGNGPPEC